jgi:hypothetical protein
LQASEPVNPSGNQEATRKISDQDVDWMIDSHRQAIRYYLRYAIALVALGVILLAVIFFFFGQTLPDAVKGLFGIGCGFVSTLSAFQFKEIITRTQSVRVLTLCKMHLHSPDETVRKSFEDLAWKSLEKMALG